MIEGKYITKQYSGHLTSHPKTKVMVAIKHNDVEIVLESKEYYHEKTAQKLSDAIHAVLEGK